MASYIGRRKFLATLGGAAAAWPLTVRAQQPAMPVVGILASVSPGPYVRFIEAIKRGLREAGYVEGRTELPGECKGPDQLRPHDQSQTAHGGQP